MRPGQALPLAGAHGGGGGGGGGGGWCGGGGRIATRFGTTWQRIASSALNPALVLQSAPLLLSPVFPGQLLCVPPDLAFVACCSPRQYGVASVSGFCADAPAGT